LSEVTGRTIEYVIISDEAARASLASFGLPASTVDTVMRLYGLMQAGKRATVTSNIEAITGQPATPFATFARDHVAAFS
jgi:hypothetical protein